MARPIVSASYLEAELEEKRLTPPSEIGKSVLKDSDKHPDSKGFRYVESIPKLSRRERRARYRRGRPPVVSGITRPTEACGLCEGACECWVRVVVDKHVAPLRRTTPLQEVNYKRRAAATAAFIAGPPPELEDEEVFEEAEDRWEHARDMRVARRNKEANAGCKRDLKFVKSLKSKHQDFNPTTGFQGEGPCSLHGSINCDGMPVGNRLTCGGVYERMPTEVTWACTEYYDAEAAEAERDDPGFGRYIECSFRRRLYYRDFYFNQHSWEVYEQHGLSICAYKAYFVRHIRRLQLNGYDVPDDTEIAFADYLDTCFDSTCGYPGEGPRRPPIVRPEALKPAVLCAFCGCVHVPGLPCMPVALRVHCGDCRQRPCVCEQEDAHFCQFCRNINCGCGNVFAVLDVEEEKDDRQLKNVSAERKAARKRRRLARRAALQAAKIASLDAVVIPPAVLAVPSAPAVSSDDEKHGPHLCARCHNEHPEGDCWDALARSVSEDDADWQDNDDETDDDMPFLVHLAPPPVVVGPVIPAVPPAIPIVAPAVVPIVAVVPVVAPVAPAVVAHPPPFARPLDLRRRIEHWFRQLFGLPLPPPAPGEADQPPPVVPIYDSRDQAAPYALWENKSLPIQTHFQRGQITDEVSIIIDKIVVSVVARCGTDDSPEATATAHKLLASYARSEGLWDVACEGESWVHAIQAQMFDRFARCYANSMICRQRAANSRATTQPQPTVVFGVEIKTDFVVSLIRGLRGLDTGFLHEKIDEQNEQSNRSLAAARAEALPAGSVRHTEIGRANLISASNLLGRCARTLFSALGEEVFKWFAGVLATHVAGIAIPLVAPFILPAASAAMLASVLFSLHESSKQGDVRFRDVFLRSIVQFFLWTQGPATGVLLHGLWNLMCIAVKKPQWQLSIIQVQDHIHSHEIASLCHVETKLPEIMTQGSYIMAEPHCEATFGTRALVRFDDIIQKVDRQCSHNIELAVCSRILKNIPLYAEEGREEEVFDHWQAMRHVIDHLVKRLGGKPGSMSFGLWVNRYAGNKKRAMLQLHAERREMKRKQKAKMFLKVEKAAQVVGGGGKNTVPRVISGCPEELTYHAGRWLVPLAKLMAEEWCKQRKGRIVYTCGLNAEQVGDAFRRALEDISVPKGDRVVIIEDDQSRFDLHMGRGAFDAIDYFYRAMLPHKVRRMLYRKMSTGTFFEGTRIRVPYTMQSGWPDTSLADTFANALMKTFIHGVNGNWSTIICGDDSVTVTTQSELDRLGGIEGLKAAYARFGMETEISVRINPLDVEFCSSRFLPVGDTFVLFPKVGKIIARAFWDPVNRTTCNQYAWARGVCNSLNMLGHYDPIIKALSTAVLRSVGDGKVIDEIERNPYKIAVAGSLVPDLSSLRLYYMHHYSFSPADISVVSQRLARVVVGSWVRSPLTRHLTLVDTPM